MRPTAMGQFFHALGYFNKTYMNKRRPWISKARKPQQTRNRNKNPLEEGTIDHRNYRP
jgi:hypothetical protein